MANTIVIKNKDRRLRNNSLQFFALTVHYKQPSDKTTEVSLKSHSKHKKPEQEHGFYITEGLGIICPVSLHAGLEYKAVG